MSLNRDAFINDYVDELKENVHTIDTCIIALNKKPEGDVDFGEDLNKLMRALHTIKGSSGMLGFNNMEKISHGMENVFKGVKEKKYTITKLLIQLVFVTTDYLREGIRKIKDEKTDNITIDRLLDVYEKACANVSYDIAFFRKVKEPLKVQDKENEPVLANEKNEPAEQEYNTIRIKLKKVDTIIKLFNKLVIRQFQFKKEKESLRELEQKIYAFTGLFNTIFIQNRMHNRDKNDELKKQLAEVLKVLQQTKKSFAENLTLVENSSGEVQEEILGLRMLPLKLVLDPLTNMVEKSALELNKEITLNIKGGDVTLDKLILEKINDPILHLVRNAVDHGIEQPEERVSQGKPRHGILSIECYAEGDNIFVKVKDDGRGLDYERIRKKALDLYPGQAVEIEVMPDEMLHKFLFMAGFSTKKEATHLSGRGVGLDIVGHNIESIKGKINITSHKSQGTEFLLSLPLSLATIEGFFVIAGGAKFLIPSHFVTELLLVKNEDMLDLYSKRALKVRGKIVPVYPLAMILGREPEVKAIAPSRNQAHKLSVLILNSLGESLGIIVDTVIQYSSLICKPLPKNLAGLRAVQGVVFDENFNIVTILYIPGILKRFKRIPEVSLKEKVEEEGRPESQSILVVDDSYFTRETIKSILELENYQIVTAVDGEDGLAKLSKHGIQLIITDISMPRMDGFAFIENVKKLEACRNIPVIVISSLLEDQQLKNKFLAIGANAFITKAEFDRTNLLTEVKGFLE